MNKRLAILTIALLQSFAVADETPAYIAALATYSEDKLLDSAELERVIAACEQGAIANPFMPDEAELNTAKWHAYETLKQWIAAGRVDAGQVCAWAKRTRAARTDERRERDETRNATANVWKHKASVLSTYYSRNCALEVGGGVRCWGCIPENMSRTKEEIGEAIAVSVGLPHVCVMLADRSVSCWGGTNEHGELNVPPDLGLVRSVAAGAERTCVVKDDGTHSCWGRDIQKKVEPANLTGLERIVLAHEYNCVFSKDGYVRLWGWGFVTPHGHKIEAIQARDISCGEYQACVIDIEGRLRCEGSDMTPPCAFEDIGDLGVVKSLAVGAHFGCAVTAEDTAECWGRNDGNQRNVPKDLGAVHAVTAGYEHACAVKKNGEVKCWGCGKSWKPTRACDDQLGLRVPVESYER